MTSASQQPRFDESTARAIGEMLEATPASLNDEKTALAIGFLAAMLERSSGFDQGAREREELIARARMTGS